MGGQGSTLDACRGMRLNLGDEKMSELATLKTEGEVSIITLDDGKANVFSYPMLETLQKILSEIPKDKGSVIITGRDGMFSGGFDLKTFASGMSI